MGSEGSSPEWLELSSELASPLPSGGPSGLEFVYGGGQFYAPVADFLEGTRLLAVHWAMWVIATLEDAKDSLQ